MHTNPLWGELTAVRPYGTEGIAMFCGEFETVESMVVRSLPRAREAGAIAFAYLVVRAEPELEPLTITFCEGSFAALVRYKEDINATLARWKWTSCNGGKHRNRVSNYENGG